MYKIYPKYLDKRHWYAPKILFNTRLTIVILLITIMQATAITNAQTISISKNNVSLVEIFMDIRKQTGYDFLYANEQLVNAKKVNIHITNGPITEVLDQCFEDQPFTYTIKNKTITVKKKERSIFDMIVQFIKTDLHGHVANQKGESIAGATVKIRGTNITVSTNEEGDFTISTAQSTGALMVSYVGYKTSEALFNVNTLKLFNISLEEENSKLQEVEINAGYYMVKDRERTGSISRVTAETLSKQPISNPLEGLIGRMAGVNIEQLSGTAGGGFKVEIRGVNSLRADGREPLYLVDGVPYPSTTLTDPNMGVSNVSGIGSPLNYLSPSDIASIEVLKDADATAIYGSRGSNGVVLITTKKAKAKTTSLDVNVSSGISRVGTKLKLLNTPQYLEMRNEAFKNDGASPGATDYDVNGTWGKNKYTDWQKVLLGGTARQTNVQTSLTGGNEWTQFAFRGNYSKQTTVYTGSFSDQKGSGTLAINHTSADHKFKADFSSTYGVDDNHLPAIDLAQYITLAPNAPDVYDGKGNLNWALDGNGAATWQNPLASLKQPYKSNSNSFMSSAVLNYELIPGLFIRSSLGYTSIRLRDNLLTPISSKAPSIDARGFNQINSSTVETWILEPQANYKKSWSASTLDILIGGTFQQQSQKMDGISGIGYTSDLLLENINAAPSKYASSTGSQYRYNAVFGRVNYTYDGKYIMNLTGRRDGSSRFGPGRQFANFGAIGLAWIFNNESIIKNNLPFLSFGKLRGSYGLTGSDQISNYGYLATYSATEPYSNQSGLFPTGLANPDYSWETNEKLEAALDLGFINDQILFSASWYRNRSSNQLVGYTLPDITGFASIQYNLPATVQNTGWEFELNTSNITTKSFTWKSSLNLTIPQNKLLSFPNIEGSTYANTYTVGTSLYTPRGYHYLGVNTQTGVYGFEDLNGDGIIDISDRKAASKALTSHLYGGLQNGLTFKNFTLDVFVQFVNKTVLNPLNAAQFSLPGSIGNQPVQVLNRWQKSGDRTDVEKFSQTYLAGGAGDQYSNLLSSDHFADASFIRLKNVSFSWNVPISWVRKAKLQSLRIYVQGQNLFTITKYIGDPEVVNLGTLPVLTTVTAGLQLVL